MRLIREMDDVRIYELEGKEVKLTVNEYSVRVVDHNNCKVGRFEFDRREDYRSDFYIITYMYLDEQGSYADFWCMEEKGSCGVIC